MSKRVNHYMMILLKNLNVYVLKFQLLPQQDLKKFLNHYLLWLQKLSHFLFTSFPTKCFTCRYGECDFSNQIAANIKHLLKSNNLNNNHNNKKKTEKIKSIKSVSLHNATDSIITASTLF